MSDSRGQVFALSVLTRIVREREDELIATLADLPSGADSPLALLPGTHFARFVLVDDLIAKSGTATPDEASSDYLLFTACFDGELDPYLWAICNCIPETADAVWGACDRYPGTADWVEFADWVEANRIRTNAFAGGYLDASLEDVGEALRLRDWLRGFAIRTRGMDAAELRTAFREEYRP